MTLDIFSALAALLIGGWLIGALLVQPDLAD